MAKLHLYAHMDRNFVKKGDRVTIYMGRVPEIAVAMLACAKIGIPACCRAA